MLPGTRHDSYARAEDVCRVETTNPSGAGRLYQISRLSLAALTTQAERFTVDPEGLPNQGELGDVVLAGLALLSELEIIAKGGASHAPNVSAH